MYKSLSFTKAAEQLYTSQPTVSEHIRNLEDQLNCKLFDRLGRTIHPTLQADTLYPKAVSILEELSNLKTEVTSIGKTIAGELLIGASSIPGNYLLPQYTAQFRQQYPKISFETKISDSTQTISAIHEKRLLLGLVGNKTFSKKIDFTPFCTDELILITKPESYLKSSIKLSKLASYPFISRETGSGTRRNMEKIFSAAGFSPNNLNIVASFGSNTAMKEAVKEGLGVAVISRHAVKMELDLGLIHEVKISNIDMSRTFYIAKLAKRTLPSQYQAFYNFLKTVDTANVETTS